MTTVHGRFFSNPNKEYVSTAVFQNVKEELGVELDATFVETLLKIMADTYRNMERPKNMEIGEYVNLMNEKVVRDCYEKVKTTSKNVDYKKLTERAAEEREYDFTKKPVVHENQKTSSPSQTQSQAHSQSHSQAHSQAHYGQSMTQAEPLSQPIVQSQNSKTVPTQRCIVSSQPDKQNQVTLTLDFRKDLIDIDNNSYCLKLQKDMEITSITLKKFMIELCHDVVIEPYIFVDIENIDDDEKSCEVEEKKVIGRMLQQSSTICNKSMYVYDQEDCYIELKNPIKTNHLYFSFYDYKGKKLNLKKINVKKVIKLEKGDLNQILTDGINVVKPGDNIIVTTVSNIKDTKGKYWQCSQLSVSETKNNSIICSMIPSVEQRSKLVLEKKILNSNISLAIFYKN